MGGGASKWWWATSSGESERGKRRGAKRKRNARARTPKTPSSPPPQPDAATRPADPTPSVPDAIPKAPEPTPKAPEPTPKAPEPTPKASEPAEPPPPPEPAPTPSDPTPAPPDSTPPSSNQPSPSTPLHEEELPPLPAGSTWNKFGGAELDRHFRHTRVVDIRWLLRFAKGEATFTPLTPYPSKRAVPAWQDVPEEAIVSLHTLRSATMRYEALPLLVLSYGWASVDHPDPTGEQLQSIRPILESIVQYCDEDESCKTWGVVWDYLALPQRGRTSGHDPEQDDRTPEQIALFKEGLGNINVWYGAPNTTTLLLDLPMPKSAKNQTSYTKRGWCIFEKRISAIIKDNECFLEVSKFTGRNSYWPGIYGECAANRPVPLLPSDFQSMVIKGMASGDVKFTNGKDATAIVIPQYERGFKHLMVEANKFDYSNLNWGDSEAKQLARALQHAYEHGGLQNVAGFDLSRNKIGDEGMLALSRVVGFMPNLKPTSVIISFNPASKWAQNEIKAASKSRVRR